MDSLPRVIHIRDDNLSPEIRHCSNPGSAAIESLVTCPVTLHVVIYKLVSWAHLNCPMDCHVRRQ